MLSSSSSSSSPQFLSSFLPKNHHHLYYIPITTISCLLLFFLSFSPHFPPSPPINPKQPTFFQPSPLATPPSFAYFLSGSNNDLDRLLRLVRAIYHPKNLYLLHLDRAAPQEQRDRLARDLDAVPAFRFGGNVHVLGRADFANERGCSALASLLHGAAVLLRIRGGWDWFVNLGADDYPLVTQDDLLHVFSFIPKDLNFVQHNSHIGWRESRMLKHIIVDPGLYLSTMDDVFYATQKRDLPNAYRIITGSSSVILSRKFVEHIILGIDNLPRTLLMYYANTPSSHKNYLQTVLCNSLEFNRTVVNDNLHYLRSEAPPKKDQNLKTYEDLNNMTLSGAAFASTFSRDDPLLNQIDKNVLNRGPRRIVPGGWCLGRGNTDPCEVWGNPDALIPGPGATRLASNVVKLLTSESFQSHQCA